MTRGLTWLGLIGGTIIIWYGILCWSFYLTILWLVISSCIAGIVLKLKEEKYF